MSPRGDIEAWLEAHAFLRPLAEVCARVERAADRVASGGPRLEPPAFDDHRADFMAGVPALQGESTTVDLEPAGAAALALVRELASDPEAGRVGEDARALDAELRREPEAVRRVAAWLLGDDSLAVSSAGLLRYLGWTAASRCLAPVVAAFERWRMGGEGENDERWLRRYCPLCGSGPAMAQLVGADPGRKRLLACGCCGSRWQFKRTGCPFCEADSHKIAVVSVEGESGLRIDYCESCRGYVKTYDGQGKEGLLLADWTSLHIDLIAQDRGLTRMAASLYAFESGSAGPDAAASGAGRGLTLPVLQ
ncbi:MAG TPA: formate dehydrogenase accessory protein FdhE [Thermoanaerobaculia bacterium]|jgi:FdhE protein